MLISVINTLRELRSEEDINAYGMISNPGGLDPKNFESDASETSCTSDGTIQNKERTEIKKTYSMPFDSTNERKQVPSFGGPGGFDPKNFESDASQTSCTTNGTTRNKETEDKKNM